MSEDDALGLTIRGRLALAIFVLERFLLQERVPCGMAEEILFHFKTYLTRTDLDAWNDEFEASNFKQIVNGAQTKASDMALLIDATYGIAVQNLYAALDDELMRGDIANILNIATKYHIAMPPLSAFSIDDRPSIGGWGLCIPYCWYKQRLIEPNLSFSNAIIYALLKRDSGDASKWVRALAAAGLESYAGSECLSICQKLADDPEIEVRRWGYRAIVGKVQDDALVVSYLRAGLAEKCGRIKLDMLRYIELRPELVPQIEELLLLCLGDNCSAVIAQALHVFRKSFPSTGVIEIVSELIWSKIESVRYEALEFSPEIVALHEDQIIRLLEVSDGDTKYRIVQSLIEKLRRDTKFVLSLEKWGTALLVMLQDQHARIWALDFIIACNSAPKSIEFALRRILDSPVESSVVRSKARDALSVLRKNSSHGRTESEGAVEEGN